MIEAGGEGDWRGSVEAFLDRLNQIVGRDDCTFRLLSIKIPISNTSILTHHESLVCHTSRFLI